MIVSTERLGWPPPRRDRWRARLRREDCDRLAGTTVDRGEPAAYLHDLSRPGRAGASTGM